SSFRDLLHTVSSRAKGASSDQKSEGTVTPLALRAHAARLADDEEHKDVERALPEAAEHPDSLNQSAQSGSSHRLSVGHELAAVADLRPAQQIRGDSGPVAARVSTGSGVATASAVVNAAADSGTGASVAVTPQSATQRLGRSVAPKASSPEAGPEPSAANVERLAKSSGPNATQAREPVLSTSQPSTATQSNPVTPNSISAAGGFEAISANIERVAESSVRDALPEATKVSVLQQETHFPPVPQFTASQQIADSVVAELKSSSASPSSTAADVTSSQSASPDQPLKVLTISLDPPALGNVTVRLRLTGDAVSVNLAASRRDTSQMLEQQRDSIRELMHSAGYVAEIAPVQHGTLHGSQTGSGQSHPSLFGQQQSSNGQGTLDGFGQSQGGARQTRQERQHNQETRHEQDVVSHDGRGAVYL
ncbi:MAG TPA: flagellar hook-length control protein FliK, partial [Acidobacteriaceae bacterium]|nr:flagellar hook-length control protein FliK [Acidobacteriaceae bacterium]